MTLTAQPQTLVVLGTGGTMAGRADDARDNVGYRAGQVAVADLVAGLALPDDLTRRFAIDCEQVAQIDSKDMSHAVWQHLGRRVAHHLARDEVAGIVITHGTDTLEETAWFLERVLAPQKPVVLTAAMRPASALAPDGPRNLSDALVVAADGRSAGWGVVAVVAGSVCSAFDVRKRHTYRLDAFESGDAGALAVVEEGRLRRFRDSPRWPALGLAVLDADPDGWPVVDLIISHAGARGAVVDALIATGTRGLVVAATGNGTVHEDLEAGLVRATAAGLVIWRSTRCSGGVLVGAVGDVGDLVLAAMAGTDLPRVGDLSAVKARVELMLRLMVRDERRA
jgi:L-asparaginase